MASLVLLNACAGKDEPRLEVWEDGAFVPRAVTAYEITGQRDGAATTAVAVFTMEDRAQLRMELEIVYNPTPALGSGHWRLDRGGSGNIHAESLKFLGGQGEGPSLGGRFRLDENGNPRFRVVLPLRPVARPNWRGGDP
jgi:hypothetical protein